MRAREAPVLEFQLPRFGMQIGALMSDQPVKVLAKGRGDIESAKPKLIAILLMTGLWDTLPISDREAWCERGEILDTVGGRLLFKAFREEGFL
jgi:hypothetical protein